MVNKPFMFRARRIEGKKETGEFLFLKQKKALVF
jgi:hypothetical protein